MPILIGGDSANIFDSNLVDHINAADACPEQFLGELLVIERIDAAAEYDAFSVLINF